MKQLLLLLFVFPILVFSQCPPDGTFNSQAEIDSFVTDYPDCTILSGSLKIEGDDITDLSGLNQITSAHNFIVSNNLLLQNLNGLNSNIVLAYFEGEGNAFSINNNASLISVSGLENLVNQSGFESSFSISNNPMLSSLMGVPNSFHTLDLMYIINNDALTSLIGIENYSSGTLLSISDNDALIDLTGVGSNYGETVYISNNNALQSLNGSESLGFDDNLIIENNQNLTDISAIYAGSYTDDGLVIRNNQNLAICNSTPVCFFVYENGIEEGLWLPGTFENNAPGCNSNYEVEYGCGLLTNDDCEFWNYPSSNNYLTLGETIQANNEYATTSSQAPSCNEVAGRQDVWFLFNSGEQVNVDIIVDAGFNLQLWEGTGFGCGDQTLVENACGSNMLLDIPVNNNTEYFVQVWSDTNKRAAGWFDLLVQDGLLSTPEFEFADINIYPNPVQNELHIQSNLPIKKIEVYNLLGQQVLESKTTTLNVSNLNEGVYLVKVISNGREFTYKIVKQ